MRSPPPVFSVVLLTAVGYLGAHRVGITGVAAIRDVLGAGLFGVVIIVAKSLLH
jgi:selenophosphate synthase